MHFFKRTLIYALAVVGLALYLGEDVRLRAQAEAASPAAASAQETPPRPPDTLFSIIFSGGPVGIAIMLVLFGVSFVATYLVIENAIRIRRGEILPAGLGEQVRQHVIAGDIVRADVLCRERPSVLSAVLLHGLGEFDCGWAEVEKAMEESLAEQAAQLSRRIEYLAVIGNIAPMLGLLGTVTGMILAFQQVANSGGNAGAADLAQGIYSALVTTVAGLMIAIPSLAALAIFRNRVDQFIAEVARQAQHAFTPLKRRTFAPATPPAPPPA